MHSRVARTRRSLHSQNGSHGLTTLELVVSLGIALAISAIAIPSITKTVRVYQLNDAASQVAGILKFTRYEAIRRNNAINCLDKPQNGTLTMFTDNVAAGGASNGVVDASERRIIFPATAVATLVDSATVPNSASLTAAVNGGALTTMSPSNGTISFDGRGAKTVPAGTSVYWVGNAVYGWRAVTVMPSGSIQVWSDATGTWKQLS